MEQQKKNCLNCGDPFIQPAKKREKKFCSTSCRVLHSLKKKKLEKAGVVQFEAGKLTTKNKKIKDVLDLHPQKAESDYLAKRRADKLK